MLLDRRERVRDGVGENERDERFFCLRSVRKCMLGTATVALTMNWIQ